MPLTKLRYYFYTAQQHVAPNNEIFPHPPTPYANVPYFLDGLGRDTCKEEIFAFYFTYTARSGKHRLSLSLSSGGGRGSDGWRRRFVITFFCFTLHTATRVRIGKLPGKEKRFFGLLSDQTDSLRVHAMTAQ